MFSDRQLMSIAIFLMGMLVGSIGGLLRQDQIIAIGAAMMGYAIGRMQYLKG